MPSLTCIIIIPDQVFEQIEDLQKFFTQINTGTEIHMGANTNKITNANRTTHENRAMKTDAVPLHDPVTHDYQFPQTWKQIMETEEE